MWDFGYDENASMNLRDSIRGRVTAQRYAGLKIDLFLEENPEPVSVFGYWSGKVPVGTEVFCSIKRWARDGRDILVTIDSVGDADNMGMSA